MARRHAVIFEEDLRIPEEAFDFEGFQRWVESVEFPENGRIDYLRGDIEVDISPEDLYTHSAVKTAIVLMLGKLIVDSDRGDVFSDRARVQSRFAGLSVEPDVFVVFASSLANQKIRLAPAASGKGDRFAAFDGPPDIVVEIVSDSSVKKDTKRLPTLYARTGVPEMWVIDARGEDLRYKIHVLRDGSYSEVKPDAEGWMRSPQLDLEVRLVRRRAAPFPWRYTLEARETEK